MSSDFSFLDNLASEDDLLRSECLKLYGGCSFARNSTVEHTTLPRLPRQLLFGEGDSLYPFPIRRLRLLDLAAFSASFSTPTRHDLRAYSAVIQA